MGGSKKAPSPPQLVAPKAISTGLPLSSTFDIFFGQEAQIPRATSFAETLNRGFRTSLEEALPGTLGATRQISTLVNQLLGGAPSADVQREAQRQLAQRNLAAGLPGTSEAAIFGEAASYGLNAMQLQEAGMAYTPQLLQLSSFLSPQQAQNYLFSTGQIRSEQLKEAQDIATVQNQNAVNKYNYDVAQSQRNSGLFGTLGGALGGIGGAILGSVVPGIGTAIGAGIGSALGGGVGSYASGGSFAAPAGAGALGSMFGQVDFSSMFRGGGGASLSPTATSFGPGGQAFTMPTSSYFNPMMSTPMNPVSNFMTPQNRGSYTGMYPISVGGISF